MILIDSWKLVVLERYVKFDGRAGRAEFWWYVLANTIVLIGLLVLAAIGGAISDALGILFILLYFVYGLATLLPNLAVAARRLHDTGKSGLLLLLLIPTAIPILGLIWGLVVGIVFIVFYATAGDPEPNQYGPPPSLEPALN